MHQVVSSVKHETILAARCWQNDTRSLLIISGTHETKTLLVLLIKHQLSLYKVMSHEQLSYERNRTRPQKNSNTCKLQNAQLLFSWFLKLLKTSLYAQMDICRNLYVVRSQFRYVVYILQVWISNDLQCCECLLDGQLLKCSQNCSWSIDQTRLFIANWRPSPILTILSVCRSGKLIPNEYDTLSSKCQAKN